MKKIKDGIVRFCKSCESLLKVAIMSGRASAGNSAKPGEGIVVLGNGPSLKDTLREHRGFLTSHKLMAVNFAARTQEFFELRPEYYVLADPHFFEGKESDSNVDSLWENLRLVNWDMTLWVPVKYYKSACRLLESPKSITIKKYNLTPVEGNDFIAHIVYSYGLGMPRPRNVLIPALMLAIREGFKTIYIAGADHSWLQSLWVDDDNRVVSVQPHFYADNSAEKERVYNEYAGYHLHDILESMVIAFRSYFDISRYAGSRDIKIYNVTPGSYIDAFKRRKL